MQELCTNGNYMRASPLSVGSFVLASLGMTFLGAISAVPEFARADD